MTSLDPADSKTALKLFMLYKEEQYRMRTIRVLTNAFYAAIFGKFVEIELGEFAKGYDLSRPHVGMIVTTIITIIWFFHLILLGNINTKNIENEAAIDRQCNILSSVTHQDKSVDTDHRGSFLFGIRPYHLETALPLTFLAANIRLINHEADLFTLFGVAFLLWLYTFLRMTRGKPKCKKLAGIQISSDTLGAEKLNATLPL